MPEIPGLTCRNGWYYYRPPWKKVHEHQERPKRIALKTQDFDQAVREVVKLKEQGFDYLAQGDRFSSWAQAYLDEKQQSRAHRQNTARAADRYVNAFCERFSHCSIRSLTRADLRAWYAELMKENIGSEEKPRRRTASTAHSYIRHVSAFLSWLVEQDALTANPALQLRLPTPRQSRRDRFCTAAERNALIETAHTDELRYILILGFHCGLRIREIVESRGDWFEMSIKRPILTVRNHGHDGFEVKSGKERQVPLNDFVVSFLESYGVNDGYMLHPEKKPGKFYLRYDPKKLFNRHCQKQGLDWVTFHTMRHTFVTLCLQAGISPFKVRRYAGLTEKAFEEHYAGLVPDDDINKLMDP